MKLTKLDLSFVTTNVTNMVSMFYSCSELTELDLSSFDTSKVTNMQSMFWNCKKLEELDISSFNTEKLTEADAMFSLCDALNVIRTPDTVGSIALQLPCNFWDSDADSDADDSVKFISSITGASASHTLYRHQWGHDGGTATCTQKATCEICSEEYGEALGHDIITHEAQQPTCTEKGWQAYEECSRCDYATDKVEIEALGHTLKHHEEVAATEYKNGNTEYWSCDGCDKYFEDEAGENEIADKTSVVISKLTPETPAPDNSGSDKTPTAPAEETKTYWWLFLLLIPIAIAVGGVMLGIYDYKK